MVKRLLALFIATALLLSCLQGILFASGTFSYGLGADAFVSYTQGGINYGDSIEIFLRNEGEGNSQDRFGLIKVDLSDWQEGEIDSVELGMYVFEGVFEGQEQLDFYLIDDDSWKEDEVTYETRPEGAGSHAATAYTSSVNSWFKADITEAVKNDEDKILSFKVYPRPGMRMKLYSKESPDNRPYVTVTGSKGYVPVTGVALDKQNVNLKLGGKGKITAAVLPENATNKNIIWTSSDANVITVENGELTPRLQGEAVITATAEDGGAYAECKVAVRQATAGGMESYRFFVTDDSYESKQETGNHGSKEYVYVSASRTGYMKYNASPIAGYDVESARINFMTRPDSEVSSVSVKGFFDNSWSEAALTDTNIPNTTGMTAELDFVSLTEKSKWYSMSVKDYVNVKNDGILSFQLTGGSSRAYIASKESGNKPYIDIVARPYSINDDDPANVEIGAKYANITDIESTALLAAAVFSQEGDLINAPASMETVAAGADATLNVAFDSQQDYAKIMFVESVTNPVPLRKPLKYDSGYSEYSHSSDLPVLLSLDGKKVTVKGKAEGAGLAGLTVVKPGTSDFDYNNLAGSLEYIGVSECDKEGNYTYSFNLGASASDGLHTAYIAFNNGSEAITVPFMYKNSIASLVEDINNAAASDIRHIVEPNITGLGLNRSGLYKEIYLKSGEDFKDKIMGIIAGRTDMTAADAVVKAVESEIALETVNTAKAFGAVHKVIENGADLLNLSNTAVDNKGNTLSYATMLSRLNDKAAPAKKVYGNSGGYTIASLESAVKSAILSSYNSQLQGEGNTYNPGSGLGGYGGKATTVDVINVPAPVPETTALPHSHFNDLDGYDWAKESINKLVEKGAVNGYGNGSFGPGDDVTREAFVKILIDGLGLYDGSTVCEFDDTDQNAWYYRHVATAVKLGIVKGIDEARFGTGSSITRQDMSVMAFRAAQTAGIYIAEGKADFDDSIMIAGYALEAIGAMQSAGIINGMGDGRFDPLGVTNRAQAAVIICRLLGL